MYSCNESFKRHRLDRGAIITSSLTTIKIIYVHLNFVICSLVYINYWNEKFINNNGIKECENRSFLKSHGKVQDNHMQIF